MIRIVIYAAFFIVIFPILLVSKQDKKFIREGNKLYEKNKFQEAEISYRKALEENVTNYKADFNLSDALYKQKNYKEAAGKFEFLTKQNVKHKSISDSYYNLGNSYFKLATENSSPENAQSSMDYLEKALNAYKKSILKNQSDDDARINYELTKRLLDQQKNNQKQNKDNKDDKNKDKNKDNKDKDNKDDKNKDQKKDNKQDQKNQPKDGNNKPEKQNNDQKQEKENNKNKIDKETANMLLNALQNQEKNAVKKMKVKHSERRKTEKNW